MMIHLPPQSLSCLSVMDDSLPFPLSSVDVLYELRMVINPGTPRTVPPSDVPLCFSGMRKPFMSNAPRAATHWLRGRQQLIGPAHLEFRKRGREWLVRKRRQTGEVWDWRRALEEQKEKSDVILRGIKTPDGASYLRCNWRTDRGETDAVVMLNVLF